MSADVILQSALTLARRIGETGGTEAVVKRDGITWTYRDGEGLTITRGDEPPVELPETALDELRWEVAE